MLESNKKELQLGLNSFNVPAETSGVQAWVRLIVQLMFLVKGTIQSEPNMGIGIQNYEFSTIDNIIDDLEAEITDQIRTYLSDIPFDSVSLERMDDKPDVLLIILNFLVEDNMETAVVASEVTNHGINFAVAI